LMQSKKKRRRRKVNKCTQQTNESTLINIALHSNLYPSMEYRKTKPTWMSPKDPDWNKGGTYPVKSPWDKRGDEAIQEFERSLNTTEYEYHSMFEVPKLSAAKQQQIDDYTMNPPFRTSYNIVEEPLKTQRKLAPGKNPPTRQPWTYGSLPSDPVPMKIHEKPPTALWTVDPRDAKKKEVIESSGDPILDSLRAQLRSHGASGIAGLARKFKIMDDDGSGFLSLDEFRKGMRECEVCELSDKSVCHLFRYFGEFYVFLNYFLYSHIHSFSQTATTPDPSATTSSSWASG
jgi:hypothetical protein